MLQYRIQSKISTDLSLFDEGSHELRIGLEDLQDLLLLIVAGGGAQRGHELLQRALVHLRLRLRLLRCGGALLFI